MKTKFDIGEKVYISTEVTYISVESSNTKNGNTERYEISNPHFSRLQPFRADELKTLTELIREERDILYSTDKKIRECWELLGDVPVDDDGNLLDDFYPVPIFPKGTNREDIWRWFDAMYTGGIAQLMNV
jgi:hypothetical protein